MTHDFIFWFVRCNDANCVNVLQSNRAVNWPTSISIGTSVFFCQVSICLRDSTWLLTEHATVALQDLTAVGPPPPRKGGAGGGKSGTASGFGMWWMLDLQTPSISSSICPACHVSQLQLSGNGELTECRLGLASWQIQIWLDLKN